MSQNKLMVVIRGAGDLASGVAYRLFKCGMDVIMTEIGRPLVVRRKVAFAETVYSESVDIEGMSACLASNVEEALALLKKRIIPVLVDPEAAVVKHVRPIAVVDARMAKRNLDTTIDEAPIVVGLGPGFTAGVDVRAVVETCRGHHLGRAIYNGSALPDTGSPGAVKGFTRERLLKSPVDGVVTPQRSIGECVEKGELVAIVEGTPVRAEITGLIRGMIKEGVWVPKNTKIGDIDPRKDAEYDSISDKALAVGGGVMEAIFYHLAAMDKKVSCY